MSARLAALLVAALTIALVIAQDVAPAGLPYHTWQYALALALGLVVIVAYANAARHGRDGAAGKRLLVAMAGAAVIALAGLASGLLGPDTATVIAAPGTVAPIPALGAAAFFPAAEPATVERGTARVILRRPGAAEVTLEGGGRRILGESLVFLTSQPAAYVEAWDGRGPHLTVTQPNSTAFLSPVLQFRQRQRIGRIDVPFDTFATPALRRVVHALYFTPQDLAAFRPGAGGVKRPALVLTASDDGGRPLGIALAPSGADTAIAGLRVRATVGAYPALAIASAPPTLALIAGGVLFLIGIAWSCVPPRASGAPARAAQGA